MRHVMIAAVLALAALPALAQPLGQPLGPAGPMRRNFAAADANHDGRVSWDEAWAVMQARFAAADANRDGGLSLEEWLAAGGPGRPAQPGRPAADPQRQQDRRASMFRALDADRNALVTLEEIRPVAEAWFRAFDANGDGAVTLEELPRPPAR